MICIEYNKYRDSMHWTELAVCSRQFWLITQR